MIRRHHPLEGLVLDVERGGKSTLLVRHPTDTLTMRIPRAWTDADGPVVPPNEKADTELTVDSLRDLVRLVDALRDRL